MTKCLAEICLAIKLWFCWMQGLWRKFLILGKGNVNRQLFIFLKKKERKILLKKIKIMKIIGKMAQKIK